MQRGLRTTELTPLASPGGTDRERGSPWRGDELKLLCQTHTNLWPLTLKARRDLSLIVTITIFYLCPGLCPLGFARWLPASFVHGCTAEGPCGPGETRVVFASASPTSAATSTKVCASEVLGNVSVFDVCLLKLDGVQDRTFCPPPVLAGPPQQV